MGVLDEDWQLRRQHALVMSLIEHAQEWPDSDQRCAQLVNARHKLRAALDGYTPAAKYMALQFMAYELEVQREARENEKPRATPGS
jgi:hypothetical protein